MHRSCRRCLTAELGKLAGDELGRAMLLEAKFGMGVKVVAPGGHFALKQIDEMWDPYAGHLHGMLKFEGLRKVGK
jgi:hypothetical protein